MNNGITISTLKSACVFPPMGRYSSLLTLANVAGNGSLFAFTSPTKATLVSQDLLVGVAGVSITALVALLSLPGEREKEREGPLASG